MQYRRAIIPATLAAATLATGCNILSQLPGVISGGPTGPGTGAGPGTGGAKAVIAGVLKAASDKTPLASYVAVAQNVLTKEIEVVAVDGSGKFSISVADAASYVLNFLDAEANYQGTLALGLVGNSGGAYRTVHTATQAVITGFKPGDLGEISLAADGNAALADASRATRDEAIKAAADGGVGIGFRLTGAGDMPHFETLKNALDEDGDGVADFLDADNDNDGRRDSIDGKASGMRPDGLPGYRTVNHFGFFTNYPTNLGQAAPSDAYVITVDIQAKPEYYGKLKEAKLLLGPGYARAATIGNRNQPGGTMERVGLWKDQGLTLYKYKGGDGVPRIEGFVMGNQAVDLAKKMNVGDVFRFLLAYDDGTVEILTNTVDVVFDTAPSNVKVNGTVALSTGHTSVAAAPKITWDLLKDASGNVIKGLTYAVEIRKENQSTPGGRVDLGVDKTEFDWSAHAAQVPYDTTAVYEIGIKAQAPGGNTSTNGLRVTALSSL